MRLSILLKTADYRGDHTTDVAVALDVLPGETVEHLAARAFGHRKYMEKEYEVLEIRPLVEG